MWQLPLTLFWTTQRRQTDKYLPQMGFFSGGGGGTVFQLKLILISSFFPNVSLELYKICIAPLLLHAMLFAPSPVGDVQIWHGEAGVERSVQITGVKKSLNKLIYSQKYIYSSLYLQKVAF